MRSTDENFEVSAYKTSCLIIFQNEILRVRADFSISFPIKYDRSSLASVFTEIIRHLLALHMETQTIR